MVSVGVGGRRWAGQLSMGSGRCGWEGSGPSTSSTEGWGGEGLWGACEQGAMQAPEARVVVPAWPTPTL